MLIVERQVLSHRCGDDVQLRLLAEREIAGRRRAHLQTALEAAPGQRLVHRPWTEKKFRPAARAAFTHTAAADAPAAPAAWC
jgi:hypothetical protein